MKKILSVIIVITVLLSGCGGKKDFSINYDLSSDPKNLDPQTSTDLSSITIIENTFSGLLATDENGNIVKDMAKDYSVSADGLEYKFTLQDKSLWSHKDKNKNHPKVTANDFYFAFKRLLNKETNASNAKLYMCIKNAEKYYNGAVGEEELGIKVISDTELAFTLEYKNDDFLRLLTLPSAKPCNQEFFEQTNGRYGLEYETTTGNGPFYVSALEHEKTLTLKRNDNYFGSNKVNIASVNMYMSQDKTVAERIEGKSTISGFVSGDEIEYFNNNNFAKTSVQNTTWAIRFNLKNKYFGDASLRKAVAYATDRTTIKDKLNETQEVATTIFPHDVILFGKPYVEYKDGYNPIVYDSKQALSFYNTALKSLSVKAVKDVKLLVSENTPDDILTYFQYVSQIYQRDLSLYIGIEKVDDITYNKRVKLKDYDIVLTKIQGVENSPYGFLSQFLSTDAQNISAYSNSTFDEYMNTALTSKNTTDSISNYQQAENTLMNDGIIIPLVYTTDYFVVSPKYSNIIYNKENGVVYFKNTKKK